MNDTQKYIEALSYIDPASCSYEEWLNVGFALQAEGADVSVWDSWSKNDRRYKPGECARKWKSFGGNPNGITGATIMKLAHENGYLSGAMDWDSVIEADDKQESASMQMIQFLEALFNPNEYIGYVTGDAWQDEGGKWLPASGVYSRTAGEVIADLKRYSDDLGAAIGDWKEEAGAWIRINPLDGKGVKNDNVTAYRYALVESDTVSFSEQERILRDSGLPIATMVFSGKKSIHALIKVDAKDYDEYRGRVEYLYGFLAKSGMEVDRQNRNPSRLSRLPGVTRNGIMQRLLAVNIGAKSWAEFIEAQEEAQEPLPPFVTVTELLSDPPVPPPEVIEGVLRQGHKMLVSGSSKAGKSFLLIELAIALSEGRRWLKFQCKKSRVLYINLEIDPASCGRRFLEIYKALQIAPKYPQDMVIWNLRGHALPLDKLADRLIRRAQDCRPDVIIVDPIYKVITGDENKASDMAYFCNQFDRIAAKTGCSVIYAHHHSKGAQGGKRAMDRASGSGVFARDPDAQLDMIELQLSDDIKNNVLDGDATAWRMECSLREFENFRPFEFYFEYPIHRIDESGELAKAYAQGDARGNLELSGKRKMTDEDRKNALDMAFANCAENGVATVADMAEYLDIAKRTVKRYVETTEMYRCENGMVFEAGDRFP